MTDEGHINAIEKKLAFNCRIFEVVNHTFEWFSLRQCSDTAHLYRGALLCNVW